MSKSEFIKHHKLLIMFLDKQILTEIDPALRRAVKWMYEENGKLLDRVVELGGKELAKEYWENWECEL